MPTGATLNVQLGAPAGATSTGSQVMSTVDANLVTTIKKNTTANNLVITYTFAATAAASPVSSATNIFTLTLQ